MTTTTTTAPAAPALDASDPGLRAELDAIEIEYPGWVLWVSEQGNVWFQAVTGIGRWAQTPELARHAIACWEHEMDVRYGASKDVAA